MTPQSNFGVGGIVGFTYTRIRSPEIPFSPSRTYTPEGAPFEALYRSSPASNFLIVQSVPGEIVDFRRS